MSHTPIIDFLNKVQADPTHLEALSAIKLLPYEERETALQAYSSGLGAPVSFEDLKFVSDEFAKIELSDAALADIAGGASPWPAFFAKVGDGLVIAGKITCEAMLDIYRN